MDKIAVVGVGPGSRDLITEAALRAIENAGVLIGGERNLAVFEDYPGERFIIKNNLEKMVAFIKEKRISKKVAILASGDPGMFGILSYLRRHFVPEELFVIPGISAMQYACAILAIPWHDAVLVSTHGRDRVKLVDAVLRHNKVVSLAAPDEPPWLLARTLVEAGIKEKTVYICSDLSYPSEEVVPFSLQQLAMLQDVNYKKNYIMVFLDE